MKLLCLDSSGTVASIAVLTEDKVIGEYTINNKKTHSQTLLPMIHDLVEMIGMKIEEIDAIAIAAGPGSFTGLRIGSATAKGLAFSLNKPIISVPTLEAIASNVIASKQLLCSIMDARNQQVFVGAYQNQNGELIEELEQTVLSVEELCKYLNEKNMEVLFLGDGIDAYQSIISEKIKVPFSVAPAHLRYQRASAVGMRAYKLYQQGKVDSANSHVPEYLRLSQAEREMKERQEKQRLSQ